VSPKSVSYSFEKGLRLTEKTVLYICRCPRVKKRKAPPSSQYLPDSSFPTPKQQSSRKRSTTVWLRDVEDRNEAN